MYMPRIVKSGLVRREYRKVHLNKELRLQSAARGLGKVCSEGRLRFACGYKYRSRATWLSGVETDETDTNLSIRVC